MDQDRKICVGIILGPHGVRGQLRLGTYTEDPESIFDYAPLTDEKGTRTFDLTVRGVGKDHYIVSDKNCTTREEAEKLKGTKLYVDRAALPAQDEGEYYHADLIGLKAQDTQGVAIGLIQDVHDHGAGAFLEIKPAHVKSFMLPFKDAFVPSVNLETGIVEVIIPEGWLADEKPPKEKKQKNSSDVDLEQSTSEDGDVPSPLRGGLGRGAASDNDKLKAPPPVKTKDLQKQTQVFTSSPARGEGKKGGHK